MIRTLLRKELHQHWPACSLLVLLTCFMALISIAINTKVGRAGSAFDGLLTILWALVPLLGLVLAHRLVALEFRHKTQLFLEALPLPRWRMIALKYVFGFVVVTVLTAAAFAVAWRFADGVERLTPRFAAILTARAAGWTWCLYSFLFLTGFLGRYRFVFYLAILGGGTALHAFTDVRFSEIGPFALIDSRFPYENTVFPAAALGLTALLTLSFIALSFLMGLAREGTVAGMLGEKMSHREKMFLAAVVAGGVTAAGVLSERQEKAPYDLIGAVEEARPGVTVKVAVPPDGNDRPATALAARTADELAALSAYLGLGELPPVFVAPRGELTAGQFERATLDAADGVLVRANFTAPDFQERAFLTWLVREVLKARTHGRAEHERKRWVLEGFMLLWPERDRAAEPLAGNAVLAERTRRAAAKGFAEADLQRWLKLEKHLGGDEANAIAWSRLKTLARRHGPDACRGFLRRALGEPVPHDARATWRDLRRPVQQLLAQHVGGNLETFLAAWREELSVVPAP